VAWRPRRELSRSQCESDNRWDYDHALVGSDRIVEAAKKRTRLRDDQARRRVNATRKASRRIAQYLIVICGAFACGCGVTE